MPDNKRNRSDDAARDRELGRALGEPNERERAEEPRGAEASDDDEFLTDAEFEEREERHKGTRDDV